MRARSFLAAKRTMTARANYERKQAHTFAEDVKRTDFQNKLHMDKLFMGANGADERVANKRRARIAAEQAQVPCCPARPSLPARPSPPAPLPLRSGPPAASADG